MAGEISCQECGKVLSGNSGIDPYKHMLRCLHVEPDSLGRIREQAEGARNENGRRILAILNHIEGAGSASEGGN